MYAVVKTGGKQYKVAENDVIIVEKLVAEAGSNIDLDEVLMIGDGETSTVGTPTVVGAKVTAEVLEQKRGKKVIVFKKKRRKGYQKLNGFRASLTEIKITGIKAGGAKKSAEKVADAPKAEAKKPAAKKPAAKKTDKTEK